MLDSVKRILSTNAISCISIYLNKSVRIFKTTSMNVNGGDVTGRQFSIKVPIPHSIKDAHALLHISVSNTMTQLCSKMRHTFGIKKYKF